MKIIYLGHSADFDEYTARVVWRWLNARTGYRGLVVIHPRAEA